MSQSKNTQPTSHPSVERVIREQEVTDAERATEADALLLLQLRQLGDRGLRQAMQLLTKDE